MTPSYPLWDSRFHYRNSASTDIRERFRQMGWLPPSEQKKKEQENGKADDLPGRIPPL